MKNLLASITLILLSVNFLLAQHDFRFKIDGLNDSIVYLANYYGDKMYYNDTAVVQNGGKVVFQGDEEKHGGVYAIIMEDKKSYFELVVNEKEIVMETNVEDLTGNMKVIKSEENKAFYEYIAFASDMGKIAQELSVKIEASSGDQKAKFQAEMDDLNRNGEQYKREYMEKYGNLFAAKMLEASREPAVPEFKDENGKMDDDRRFRYFKQHYFDYIDLSDDRFLYTPVLDKKLTYYIEKLTAQIPDSICQTSLYLTDQTADTSLIYKYIVQKITNTYEESQIMGMDAVFVCMAENYYTQDKAWWLDTAKLDNILDLYEVRQNLIIGEVAENIVLMDPDSNWKSLYDIDAPYTVVVFWSPDCGHCKKELPVLLKSYHESKETLGFEVFAVGTEFKNNNWKKFISENELEWINVSDNPEINQNAMKYIVEGKTTLNSLNFRDFWDIYSTPQVYVLDDRKKIIAKKLAAEQIADFISRYDEKKNL
jgi:thiol-disulfide isomerase/thioredoxin